jgi:tetratricopeptide (TPR) repeat protein
LRSRSANLRDPDALPVLHRLEQGMELARIDPATAVRELSAVLVDAPDAALPRRYRAVALAAEGHNEAAIADMRVLEKSGSLTTEDLIVLGDCLRLAGRTDEALAALDKAAALQPQSPLPWLTRANTLIRAGRTDEAASAYERALAISPEHAEALRGLGDLAFVGGDMPAAAGFYARVLAAAPLDAGAMVKLGVVRMRGQRDQRWRSSRGDRARTTKRRGPPLWRGRWHRRGGPPMPYRTSTRRSPLACEHRWC